MAKHSDDNGTDGAPGKPALQYLMSGGNGKHKSGGNGGAKAVPGRTRKAMPEKCGPQERAPSKSDTMSGGFCGKKNRAGKPCRQRAGARTDHSGTGPCWPHGGATPRGVDSPHYRHGLHSKYAGPRSLDTGTVTREEIEVADDEVVAAVQHARGMAMIAANGADIKPEALLEAFDRVTRIKLRAAELKMKADIRPVVQGAIREAAAIVIAVLLQVGVDDEIRGRVAAELRRRVAGRRGHAGA
jgi:hypothetical protein